MSLDRTEAMGLFPYGLSGKTRRYIFRRCNKTQYVYCLVSPAEDGRDLLGEGEGIEGFEEDSGEAQAGEASLIISLNLGGEKEDGDLGDGGSLLHSGEGGGAVD